MNYRLSTKQIFLGLLVLVISIQCKKDQTTSNKSQTSSKQKKSIEMYHTNSDGTLLFKQENKLFEKDGLIAEHTIEIDASQGFQYMQGFGFALTGGSAEHIMSMNDIAKEKNMR